MIKELKFLNSVGLHNGKLALHFGIYLILRDV